MKEFIKNRHGLKVAIVVKEVADAKGVVFIMHGLGSRKERPLLQLAAQVFNQIGITAVRFDATNSFNESEGNYENATVTNYYEDLEDVINWSKGQSWYQEPFWLMGHSLGGICVALYAEKFPQRVKALAPISTVISGKISVTSPTYTPEVLADWEKTGWMIRPSSEDGTIRKLKWNHMADRMKYDLLQNVSKLTMPVLMLVGSEDKSTPPNHQQVLFDALSTEKEMHIIEGAPHSFRDPKHLAEIETIFDSWIQKHL